MELSSREEMGCTVVSIGGRLDTVTAPEFEARCMEWIAGGSLKMVLDFSRVDYISSAGLRSVLVILKRLKAAGGGVAISGMTGVVREVFAISGLDAVVPVAADLSAALASV
jgi:anti-sigma B factor antagonist